MWMLFRRAVRSHSKSRIPARQLPLRVFSEEVAVRRRVVHTNVERYRVGGDWSERRRRRRRRAVRRRAGASLRREPAVGCRRTSRGLPELRAGLLGGTVRRRTRLHGRVRPAAARHSAGRPEPLHHRHCHPDHCHCTTAKDQGQCGIYSGHIYVFLIVWLE